jgi:hypothetical protein
LEMGQVFICGWTIGILMEFCWSSMDFGLCMMLKVGLRLNSLLS